MSGTLGQMLRAWRLGEGLTQGLPKPDVAEGPDGQLLYSWNANEHHFELEISPDGAGEFFYLNLQTNEVWEYDCAPDNHIPDQAREMLGLLVLGGSDASR